MGKFPHSSLKAHNIFPTHGLAVVVKKNFPTRGFAALGEFFFTTPAKPFVGKIKCAFRDSWGIFFSSLPASPVMRKNPIPISPQ